MNPAQLYERVLAGDASCNGRFFFGVTTTGIYCLPSCKARKPKPANTRFFATTEAARAAGLRPCKKCRPDDFALGADPILENIEQLVAEIRANPSAFRDARAIVKRSGFGPTLPRHARRHPAPRPARPRQTAPPRFPRPTYGRRALLRFRIALRFP
jgi:AraC family transcriptional regulator of adaptative response / DNA-3-methyladenine glycosylase II